MIKKNDPLDILKKKYLKMNHTKMKIINQALIINLKDFSIMYLKIKIKKFKNE